MAEKSVEIAIEVPAETRLAIERAAAEQRISVSEFIKKAVQRMLAEAGHGLGKAGTE